MLSIFVLEGRNEQQAHSSDALLLVNEYAKSDCTADLVRVLHQANYANVDVRCVTLSTVDVILDAIVVEARTTGSRPVIFNLCDGLETGSSLSVVVTCVRFFKFCHCAPPLVFGHLFNLMWRGVG